MGKTYKDSPKAPKGAPLNGGKPKGKKRGGMKNLEQILKAEEEGDI